MVERFSAAVVNIYIKKSYILQEERDFCIYSLTCWIEKLISIVLIFLLGVLCNSFFGSCIFCFYFWGLHRYSGGYHAKSFSGCLMASAAIYLVMVYTVKSVALNAAVYILLLVISAGMILAFSPVNDSNFRATLSENEYHRRNVVKWTIIEVFLSLGTYILNFPVKVTQYCILSFLAIALLVIMGHFQKKVID